MKTLIIYAHPWDGSYCNALLQSVLNGLKYHKHSVDLLDLNKEDFNPGLVSKDLALYSKGMSSDENVSKYQKRLKECEYLIIIFPIWWGSMPAVLKGFIDKVFLPEFSYKPVSRWLVEGRLNNIKGCTIITTMNSPFFFYNLFLHNPIKQILVKDTLKLCGIKKVKMFQLRNVKFVSKNKREKWLKKFESKSVYI